MSDGAGFLPVTAISGADRSDAARLRVLPWSRRLVLLVAASMLLLLAVTGLALRSQSAQRVDAGWVLHTEQVRYQLARITQLVAEAQAAAQSYALIGDEPSLSSYREADAALGPEIRTLQQLVSDNPPQVALAGQLAAWLQQLVTSDETLLQAAHQGRIAQVHVLLADDSTQRLMQQLRSVISAMQSEEGRLLDLRHAAAERAQQWTLIAVWLSGGLAVLLIVVAVYVTRRDEASVRRAYEAAQRILQVRDAELQIINDHVRFPIAHCDPRHHYIFVNRAYAERLGVTPELCAGRHIRDVAGDAAYQAVRPHIEQALAGQTVEFELDIPYAGELGSRWMRCIYAPVRGDAGQVHSFVAAVTDITDKKRDEKERQRLFAAVDAERDRLSLVLNSINDEVWFADTQGRFTLANPSALREFGLPGVEGLEIAKVADSLVVLRADGSPRPPAEAPPLRALAGESVLHEEEIVRTPRTGMLRHREVSATPVRDRSGAILGAVAVVRDITEQKRAEAALREADRRKDEFLATLSHELRNPLAPIRTAVQILAAPQLSPHQYKWAQAVIVRQVQHMALLLDDLLDVARITQGKLELRKQHVTLGSVIDAAVETARPFIDGKHHRLTVELPEESLSVEADPLRLSQMLSNLLVNAAKYTDPGGDIALSASTQDDSLALTVKDNGIGISQESMTRIFDMFSQVSGASASSDGGLGIGLALVKGLTELHGGTIEARSAGLSLGSEFIIRLPLSGELPAHHAGMVSRSRSA
jgi:PAS domain S-box-containing protein